MIGTEQTRVPTRQRAGGARTVLDDLGAELVAEHAVGRGVEGRHADGVHEPG